VSQLFRLSNTAKRDPAIDRWMRDQPDDLGAIARAWFDTMRACGGDVRETMHDDQPTACIADAAFGYVDAFTAHVNVGFFRGARLPDPAGLLEGSGKSMRHVKIKPGSPVNETALVKLIEAAYADLKEHLSNPR
jgi:hypothetical protein